MKLDKKAISKALCLSAVCCVLLTNVAYANDKTNCENVQTASIAVNTTDAYYKVIEQKNVYAEEKNPFLEKEYLDKAKVIADKFPNDKSIQRNYHENLSNFYSNYGNSYATVAELEKALKYLDTNDIDASISMYNQLARYYAEVNDYEKADLMLKKKAKILKNNKHLEYKVGDYATRMYHYIGQGKLSVVLPAYTEGKSILDKNNFENKDLYFELNEPLISYYLTTYNVNSAKTALDYHLNLAKKEKRNDLKSFVLGEYVTYYGIMQDLDSAKKLQKALLNTNKKLYDKNSTGNVDGVATQINYYQWIGDSEKAEKLAIKNANYAEQFKDIAPVVYANTLKQLAQVKLDSKKIAEALSAVKEAKQNYLIALPKNSLNIYETEKLTGDIYMSIGDIEQGIKHYETAKNILNKTVKNPFNNHIDIYKNLADAYSQNGNTEKAITEINKAINVATSTYGENNIRTLWLQLDKANIYKNGEQCVLAKNQINNILDKVNAKKVSDPFDIEFQCYMFLAYDDFDKGNYDDALANATKALQNPFRDENKDGADALISEIYKAQDKKLKSLKHKIKSKI
ncbi:tetratricopeptide repeat protein [bacterium]|nr:tetratricopeptide repeat protein [bacterium]